MNADSSLILEVSFTTKQGFIVSIPSTVPCLSYIVPRIFLLDISGSLYTWEGENAMIKFPKKTINVIIRKIINRIKVPLLLPLFFIFI